VKRDRDDVKDAKDMFDETDLVFVYGTLKRGYGNNRLLRDSLFVSEDYTPDGWVMGSAGCPYSFPPRVVPDEYSYLGHKIKGEVYQLRNWFVARQLDWLEGYPHHYDREIITTEGGRSAWIYIQPEWSYAEHLYSVTLHEGAWSWP